MFFHETGPWCQKTWGSLLWSISSNSGFGFLKDSRQYLPLHSGSLEGRRRFHLCMPGTMWHHMLHGGNAQQVFAPWNHFRVSWAWELSINQCLVKHLVLLRILSWCGDGLWLGCFGTRRVWPVPQVSAVLGAADITEARSTRSAYKEFIIQSWETSSHTLRTTTEESWLFRIHLPCKVSRRLCTMGALCSSELRSQMCEFEGRRQETSIFSTIKEEKLELPKEPMRDGIK